MTIPTRPAPPGERVARGPGLTAAASVRTFDDDFEPSVVAVKEGEIVEWYHTGFRQHTVTALDRSWDSGGFSPAETFLMRFNTAGTYQYLCLDHPWMRGIVVVEG